MQHGHVAVALLGRQADHPRVIILQPHSTAHRRGKTCAKFKFANWREIQISPLSLPSSAAEAAAASQPLLFTVVGVVRLARLALPTPLAQFL